MIASDELPASILPLAPLHAGRAASESFFEPDDERRKRETESMAKRAELNHIEATLAAFALAYKRLRLSYALRKFDLADAGAFPGGTELSQKDRVLARCDALIHGLQSPQ